MGRRKKKSKKPSTDCVVHSSCKPTSLKTNIVLPKPRYLVLSRDHPTETLEEKSLAMITNVITTEVGKVNSIKKQRNGSVLIETKTETQSSKLMKMKYFPSKVAIKVTPHRWLNFCKGVIKCWEIKDLSIEEMKIELRSQSVVDVKPITTKATAAAGEVVLERTSCYILTFSLPSLPKVVKMGPHEANTTPYIPQPKMCYRCFQYGHISKHCKATKQICNKCGKAVHGNHTCTSPISCVNCLQNFQAGHSSCVGYMVHRKILEIDCFLKYVNLDG